MVPFVDKMKKLLSIPGTIISIAILILILALMLLVVPAEKTLGNIIKVVFLHAALVQGGLLLFATAAVLGVISFFRPGTLWSRYCLAAQKTALIMWILYALSSMWVTWLAWGKAIAWEEPRVRTSAMILFLAFLIFMLVMWIREKRFTALANIVLGSAAWLLTKSAGLVQHPANPIGRSDSQSLHWLLFLNLGLVLLISAQAVRLFVLIEGPTDNQ